MISLKSSISCCRAFMHWWKGKPGRSKGNTHPRPSAVHRLVFFKQQGVCFPVKALLFVKDLGPVNSKTTQGMVHKYPPKQLMLQRCQRFALKGLVIELQRSIGFQGITRFPQNHRLTALEGILLHLWVAKIPVSI